LFTLSFKFVILFPFHTIYHSGWLTSENFSNGRPLNSRMHVFWHIICTLPILILTNWCVSSMPIQIARKFTIIIKLCNFIQYFKIWHPRAQPQNGSTLGTYMHQIESLPLLDQSWLQSNPENPSLSWLPSPLALSMTPLVHLMLQSRTTRLYICSPASVVWPLQRQSHLILGTNKAFLYKWESAAYVQSFSQLCFGSLYIILCSFLGLYIYSFFKYYDWVWAVWCSIIPMKSWGIMPSQSNWGPYTLSWKHHPTTSTTSSTAMY